VGRLRQHVSVVVGAAEKAGREERAEQAIARRFVEPPQPLDLRPREMETRYLEILGLNNLQPVVKLDLDRASHAFSCISRRLSKPCAAPTRAQSRRIFRTTRAAARARSWFFRNDLKNSPRAARGGMEQLL
jgi:hypothetical protein